MEEVVPIRPRKLSFSDSDPQPTATSSEPQRMRTFVRVRPISETDQSSQITTSDVECAISIQKTTAQGTATMETQAFTFDRVFNAQSTQEQVFEAAMRPQVAAMMAGQDTLTFAYGITNAGKTYTIKGKDAPPEQRGLLPRALTSIFEALTAQRATHKAAGNEPPAYQLKMSILELYDNKAYDLLAPEPAKNNWPFGRGERRTALKISEERGCINVRGLRDVELIDLETALEAVERGFLNRQSASNGVNDESSRSHAVLTIKFTTPGQRPVSLNIVDLAGAERQKLTQSTSTRLNEANAINKDLMSLGHCLRDLRWNQDHARSKQRVPPFRDSRVTMLFRDYLQGLGQTVVIAAVNPKLSVASSTLETLRFAAEVHQIRMQALPPQKPVPALRQPSAKRALRSKSDENAAPNGRIHALHPGGGGFGGGGGGDDDERAVVGALQAQVHDLESRLVEVEEEKVAMEVAIREEVSAEMKLHIERHEEEMQQRLEEAQFSTEEAYLKKLQLAKSCTARTAGEASVQAHMDILQLDITLRQRETDYKKKLDAADTELNATRAELAVLHEVHAAGGSGGAANEVAEVALRDARELANLRKQLEQLQQRAEELQRDKLEEAAARADEAAARAKAEAALEEARAAHQKAEETLRTRDAEMRTKLDELEAAIAGAPNAKQLDESRVRLAQAEQRASDAEAVCAAADAAADEAKEQAERAEAQMRHVEAKLIAELKVRSNVEVNLEDVTRELTELRALKSRVLATASATQALSADAADALKIGPPPREPPPTPDGMRLQAGPPPAAPAPKPAEPAPVPAAAEPPKRMTRRTSSAAAVAAAARPPPTVAALAPISASPVVVAEQAAKPEQAAEPEPAAEPERVAEPDQVAEPERAVESEANAELETAAASEAAAPSAEALLGEAAKRASPSQRYRGEAAAEERQSKAIGAEAESEDDDDDDAWGRESQMERVSQMRESQVDPSPRRSKAARFAKLFSGKKDKYRDSVPEGTAPGEAGKAVVKSRSFGRGRKSKSDKAAADGGEPEATPIARRTRATARNAD